ncbi:hypothetical protein V3C99_018645, partial [Haemonchus contortus]
CYRVITIYYILVEGYSENFLTLMFTMRSIITKASSQIKVISVLFAIVYANKDRVDRHLELGKRFLAKGQFADALSHYHAAIDLDPLNYQTLYRRATVYLAMGKSKSALPDLDKVVELKGDFTA